MKQILYILTVILLGTACNDGSLTKNGNNQSDTINSKKLLAKAPTNKEKEKEIRISYKNVSDIVADTNYSTWVELNDSSASLALHFMEKNTISISYSPECWLMYPYTLRDNKIMVFWDNNIDTKYDFDIVKTVNKIDKKYLGRMFMVLELVNDTTLRATYPIPDLIKKINSTNKERTFFPEKYTLIDFYL